MDMKLNQQGDREMKECIYNEDDRLYLQMLQGNIKRMSENSSKCKIWAIALVSAFLTLNINVIDNTDSEALIAVIAIPIFIFWYLDGLYLKYERGLRNREIEFLNNIETEKYKEMLFNFEPLLTRKSKDKGFVSTKRAMWSKSVAPFYITIIIVSIMVVTGIDIYLQW